MTRARRIRRLCCLACFSAAAVLLLAGAITLVIVYPSVRRQMVEEVNVIAAFCDISVYMAWMVVDSVINFRMHCNKWLWLILCVILLTLHAECDNPGGQCNIWAAPGPDTASVEVHLLLQPHQPRGVWVREETEAEGDRTVQLPVRGGGEVCVNEHQRVHKLYVVSNQGSLFCCLSSIYNF